MKWKRWQKKQEVILFLMKSLIPILLEKHSEKFLIKIKMMNWDLPQLVKLKCLSVRKLKYKVLLDHARLWRKVAQWLLKLQLDKEELLHGKFLILSFKCIYLTNNKFEISYIILIFRIKMIYNLSNQTNISIFIHDLVVNFWHFKIFLNLIFTNFKFSLTWKKHNIFIFL